MAMLKTLNQYQKSQRAAYEDATQTLTPRVAFGAWFVAPSGDLQRQRKLRLWRPIGLGSLTLTDNGTTVFGQVNKGPNGFNDVLVIYLNSTAGGFADTSGFADGADGLRKAISGFDGGANRSLLTMPGGFLPDYAIALGPASDNFGGLWQLANGGANSLNFIPA